MASVFITGSADGLGRLAALELLDAGHALVVHARSEARAAATDDLVARGAGLVVGDLSDQSQVRSVAEQVNAIGRVDAVIHNAGVYTGNAVMPVNVVAPYLLTALIDRPARLIYLSSGMHRSGAARIARTDFAGGSAGSYSDSKLFVTALALAVAQRWPQVLSNAVDPGWVPTRMGGAGAPDDLELGHRTQAWLATSDDPKALTSGGYWYHQAREVPEPAAADPAVQTELLAALAEFTGTALPE